MSVRMMQPSDILSFLDFIPGMSDILAMTTILWVVMITASVVIAAAAYIFRCWTIMLIGRKAGLTNDWMPFVPIARALYRLRIIDEQWWKLFFLEDWALYALILTLLGRINGTLALIVLIIYSVCCVAYRMYYRYFYFKALSINPTLVICVLALAFPGVDTVINVLTGYTGLIDFGGKAAVAPMPAGEISRSTPSASRPQNFTGSMTCLSGMYAGNTFSLAPDEEMIIGRDAASANIILEQNSEKVSRRHCGVLYNSANQTYYVTDYSSKNGTFTRDGSRLVSGIATALPAGTVINLGDATNSFLLNR